jgi:hypothetical protein
MSETYRDLPITPERLEQSFEEATAIAMAHPSKSGPLNAFLGATELTGMGQHLIQHMRDEDRWGETRNFEPIDFVLAATEVAYDHTKITSGRKTVESSVTNLHVSERIPAQVTFNIFIDFWLPRIATWAYGEEYADEVRAILQTVS